MHSFTAYKSSWFGLCMVALVEGRFPTILSELIRALFCLIFCNIYFDITSRNHAGLTVYTLYEKNTNIKLGLRANLLATQHNSLGKSF